jgi:cobalt-zinc-cadmium efflux system outer membrane protein
MYTNLLRLCACLLSASAIAAPPDAVVQATPALTLATAQAKVLQHSPTLQALSYQVGAHDGQVKQAGMLPNPELSALVEDRQSATRTTTIQLTQSIETGGKRGARVDAAQQERELAMATLRVRQGELRAETSKAFHALLAMQGRLELAETTLALAKQALAGANLRVTAGKNSPVDATRGRIAVAGAEIDLLQARGDVDNAREILAALWGGSAQDLGRIEGRLDQLPVVAPLPVLIERLQQAPGIARAAVELRRRIALGRVESTRRMPDLAVTIGSKKDEQLGRRQAVFGVALPLPLFDRNQGAMHEALQRTEQARAELAAAAASLASELRVAHTRLSVARRQAAALADEQLPGARSTYDAARKGYEYGKFNILDVFDAQRVLLQAQAQHLRVLADGHSAAADIERILGAPGVAKTQESQ